MSFPNRDQPVSRLTKRKEAIVEALSTRKAMIAMTLLPALLLFIFINLVPIFWAIFGSFHNIGIFDPEWTWTGFENYVTIFESSAFWMSLWRSTIFAGGSVVIQLTFGIGFALLINRSFKYSTFVRAIALLPYLVPTAVLGFVALWMNNGTWGVVNQILFQVGLIDEFIPWYGSRSFAMLAVVVTSSWKFSIFVTLLVLARLQGIPDKHYEAAEVLGATSYQQLRDITLPNIKGVIFIVLLLRGIWMFNKFDIIWILTSGGPNVATTTAPIKMYRLAYSDQVLGESLAMAVILFIILMIVAVLYFQVFNPSQEVNPQ